MNCNAGRVSPMSVLSLFVLITFLVASSVQAETLPDWAGKIRSDHPRLFFNADTWPAVRDRALHEENGWYESINGQIDRLANDLENAEHPAARELGPEAAWAAFVFLITEESRYLDLAKKCLDASLRYYDECFEQKKSVNWYSTSRVHAVLAWDWLYNHMTEAERQDTMSRLVTAVDRVLKARPTIYRENMSGYNTGFYGVRNCLWFIGHGSAPTVLRPAYVPMEMQERVRSLAQQHNALLAERDLPHGAVFEAKPEGGEVPSPFNLTSALYHISGAIPLTHECPHGVVGEEMCDVTFDQILDIQLTLYEAMFRAALDGR